MITYRWIIKIANQPYTGSGYFKFAIIDSSSGNGGTNYWSNGGTVSGVPSASVQINVKNGLFQVYLGDTSLMSVVEPTVFNHNPTYLRIWFSTTPSGPFTALEPNQRIISVAYSTNADMLDG